VRGIRKPITNKFLCLVLLGTLLSVIGVYFWFSSYNVRSSPPHPSVCLISYEWNVTVISWEFEYVELNLTLLNSGNVNAEFTLEINLFDNETHFWSEQYDIELAASAEETFTKRVYYELLFNRHHAKAVEFTCGIFDENGILKETYIHVFSSKPEKITKGP